MSKYKVLSHPSGHDCSLMSEEFDTVQEAVVWAMDLTMGNDFLIIQVVNWKVELA